MAKRIVVLTGCGMGKIAVARMGDIAVAADKREIVVTGTE